MKALLALKDNLRFPDYSDNRALADDMSGFFCRKVTIIRHNLSVIRAAIKDGDKVQDENQRIYKFRQLSREEVHRLVQTSGKKTCTLDPMPTSMVVACLEELGIRSFPMYLERLTCRSTSQGNWERHLILKLAICVQLPVYFKTC